MRLILVRHGEIYSNLRKVYAGWSDESLTIRGVEQAHDAGQFLADRAIEIIYTSPLSRAVQTAELIARRTHTPIVLEPAFTELRMGPWEGKSEEQVAIEYPYEWKVWLTRPAELKLPGHETLHEVLDRVLSAFTRIKNKNHKGGVVIVTHYAIIRVALLHVKGQDLNLYKNVIVPNCKPFELEA